jgi:hypothetical protein
MHVGDKKSPRIQAEFVVKRKYMKPDIVISKYCPSAYVHTCYNCHAIAAGTSETLPLAWL